MITEERNMKEYRFPDDGERPVVSEPAIVYGKPLRKLIIRNF
jgi:hypothetical protein